LSKLAHRANLLKPIPEPLPGLGITRQVL